MANNGRELIKNVSELDEFLAFVVLYAPTNFLPHHNLDLHSAFSVLLAGVDACASGLGGAERVSEIKAKIVTSLDDYRTGNVVKAAHALQEISHAL